MFRAQWSRCTGLNTATIDYKINGFAPLGKITLLNFFNSHGLAHMKIVG